MDVLGLTFEEVSAAAAPRLKDLRPLRAAYRAVLRGETAEAAVAEAGVTLAVKTHPVVRHVRDRDLVKFVQRTPDGLEIESVVVPMRRKTLAWTSLCVSSQIGCARGCAFCETARMGLLRQLNAAEIVGQVVAARRDLGADVRNVVFMGMGEPLDNLDAVIQAVRVLSDRSGLSIGKPQITISTVGRPEGIRRLAALGWRRLNLAVSLNAPNDEIRSRIMPINRLEPMGALREALLDYPLRSCQFFMIEYVLIPGVNDSQDNAAELADFLRPVKCCVNVIPFNPAPGSPFKAPDEQAVQQFLSWLQQAGQYCKPRLTKGRSQMAACGQLGNAALRQVRQTKPAGDPVLSP